MIASLLLAAAAHAQPTLDAAQWRLIPGEDWRFQQVHHGVPVLGGGAVLRSNGQTSIREHPVSRASVVPMVSENEAIQRALQTTAGESPTASLWVLPDGGEGRLVWRVVLYTAPLGSAHRVTIDADTGDVLMSVPLRTHASGQVYTHSVIDDDLAVVTLEELFEGGVLEGTWADVYSVTIEGDATEQVRHAIADEDGNFLYEPEHSSFDDPFAEVSMYHHITSAAVYFSEQLKHPIPGSTEAVANYHTSSGSAFDNAYFSYTASGGYQLVFGQGTGRDFGYMPDVIFHEFGHGVVEDVTGIMDQLYYPVNFDELGFHVGPGALTEGLPDYFAASYHDNPILGRYTGFAPIRDLSADLRCPEDIFGEAHADGNVLGVVLWEIRDALGAQTMDPLVYATMEAITVSPSFADFATAMLDTAELVGLSEDEITAIEAVFDDRGFTTCDRSISLTPGESTEGFFLGADLLDESLCELMRVGNINFTPPFQFALEVPDDAIPGASIGLSLALEPLSGGEFDPEELNYTLLARLGSPVEFQLDFIEIFGEIAFVTEGATFDEIESDSPAAIMIEDVSPGETWYVAAYGNNCRSSQYTASVDFLDGEVAEPVGCGCTSASTSGGLVAVFAGLLIGWRRRSSTSEA